MQCPRCDRRIQMGLAILMSSLASAVDAATLEESPNNAAVWNASQTLTSPNSIESQSIISETGPKATIEPTDEDTVAVSDHVDSTTEYPKAPTTETPESSNGYFAKSAGLPGNLPTEALPKIRVLSPDEGFTDEEEILIAQITPDTTLRDEASVVTSDVFINSDLADQIEGGAVRGPNLFHSFHEFNVNTGQQVYFANPVGIENILSRVTGADVSDIDGVLGVNGAANLFLLNPNGIIFGSNAQLDIRGSFTASTADSLAFVDGQEFKAVPLGNEVLSVSVPLGVQLNNQPQGNITNTGTLETGQDLTLLGNQLSLEGQLLAGQDLTLQAQDTVTVRDTTTEAFMARAGRDLIIQGNQQVDIFALNYPASGLFSGNDLILRSDNPVIGDARFYGGNNLQVEKLDGSRGNLLSPNDPIILANGNVSLGDYSGASLHILAGGSVTLGNVTINNTGTSDSTINPKNTTPFNSNLTYADLATFEVPDYEVSTNEDGTLSQVPIQRSITVDGSAEATLDVRAGVDWDSLGGLPTDLVVVGEITSTLTNSSDVGNSDISLTGAVEIVQPDGQVILTNQFQSDDNLAAGVIDIEEISTRALSVPNADGGNILIYGRGDVSTNGGLDSTSLSVSDVGQGGDISIASQFGNISINGDLESFSAVFLGDSKTGGDISIASQFGNITTNGDLNSASFQVGIGNARQAGKITISSQFGDISTNGIVESSSISGQGDSGAGGAILITSQAGDIITNDFLNSSSFSSVMGDSGTGGAISIFSQSGNISTIGNLRSTSLTNQGDSGIGGAISISSESGDITTNGFLLSGTSALNQGNSGTGGAISIASQSGGIITNETLMSSSLSNQGDAGVGGAISIASQSSDITTDGVLASSSTALQVGNADTGGNISIFSEAGDVVTNNFLVSGSASIIGNAGAGGNISIFSEVGDITANEALASGSSSASGNSGTGGSILIFSEAGDITTKERLASNSAALANGNAGTGGNILASTQSGNISIQAPLSSFSFSEVGDAGAGGDISLSALAGSIQGSSNTQLLSFSLARAEEKIAGTGGNVILEAKDSLSALEILTLSSTGQSGNVQVEGLGNLLIQDVQFTTSAQVSVTAPSSFQPSFTVPDEISDIDIDATATLDTTGFGPSGDVIISADNLILDNVQILSNANGSNAGGDITITDVETVIFNETTLQTDTSDLGTAGSILIQNVDTLIMRDNNLLLADAGGQATGGNIDIDVGFLISPLNKNNDILVTAVDGQGGRIEINAINLLGFTERSESDTSVLRSLLTNDLSAGSQTGEAGDVVLNILNADPSRGLSELPTLSSVPPVQRGCSVETVGTSSFTITGRGGLPSSPTDILNRNQLLTDLGPNDTALDASNLTQLNESPTATPGSLVEAQGLAKSSDGRSFFVTQLPATLHNAGQQQAIQCSGSLSERL